MKYIIILILLFSTEILAKTIGIAVLDTGINERVSTLIPICENINFTTDNKRYDTHGHGTNITLLIHNQLRYSNLKYCFYILKVFGSESNSNKPSVSAFEWIVKNSQQIQYINYSGGGLDFSGEENSSINIILNSGITMIVAAGNWNIKLEDYNCSVFPACYDKRIVVVGNGVSEEKKAASSNYGKRVTVWEDGNHKCVKVPKKLFVPKTEYDICMSGTSQSTAIVTGKMVRSFASRAEYNKDAEYEDAVRTTADYIYKTSGVGEMINNKVQEHVNKTYPREIRDFFNIVSPFLRFISTGVIEVRREF